MNEKDQFKYHHLLNRRGDERERGDKEHWNNNGTRESCKLEFLKLICISISNLLAIQNSNLEFSSNVSEQ